MSSQLKKTSEATRWEKDTSIKPAIDSKSKANFYYKYTIWLRCYYWEITAEAELFRKVLSHPTAPNWPFSLSRRGAAPLVVCSEMESHF